MIARIPELSLSDTSERLKPSRLSISSWLSTRSVPPLPLLFGENFESSEGAADHCAAVVSRPGPAPPVVGAAASAVAASGSSASPHSAAMASCSIWSLDWLIFLTSPSLNDDFLEQHGVDAGGRDRDVNAARQFLLQPVEAGRAVEIARTQFAKVGLERVHDARHDRRDLLDHLLLGQLEHDLDPQILRALGARVGEIDKYLRQIDEHRGLDQRILGLGVMRVGEKEEI